MKRHSIKFKFFVAISAVALVFIGVLLLLNLFFYDDYYLMTRKTELRDTYHRTAARTGGVAVGLLTEGRCGVCRTVIDGGRLIDLKAEAPLGTCPHCKRLLVVM